MNSCVLEVRGDGDLRFDAGPRCTWLRSEAGLYRVAHADDVGKVRGLDMHFRNQSLVFVLHCSVIWGACALLRSARRWCRRTCDACGPGSPELSKSDSDMASAIVYIYIYVYMYASMAVMYTRVDAHVLVHQDGCHSKFPCSSQGAVPTSTATRASMHVHMSTLEPCSLATHHRFRGPR